jgi:hypothetical protein
MHASLRGNASAQNLMGRDGSALRSVTIGLQLDLIERTVFALGVLDSPLASIAATKDRDLAGFSVFKQLFDPPISGADAIPKHLGPEIF